MIKSSAAAVNTAAILERKATAKAALQRELGWPQEPRRAMVCIPTGMTDALGGKLLEAVVPGLLTLPIDIVILGKGTNTYGTLFTELASKHSHRIAILPAKDSAINAMYDAADLALFFADAGEGEELDRCLHAGVIPVAPSCKTLKTYNPNQESGNSFTYDTLTQWHSFAAIVRALETYRFPFDWKTIQKHAIGTSDVEDDE